MVSLDCFKKRVTLLQVMNDFPILHLIGTVQGSLAHCTTASSVLYGQYLSPGPASAKNNIPKSRGHEVVAEPWKIVGGGLTVESCCHLQRYLAQEACQGREVILNCSHNPWQT